MFLVRHITGESTESEVSHYSAVDALHDFSLEMFEKLTEASSYDENFAFSPISLFSATSILLEGKCNPSLNHIDLYKFTFAFLNLAI